MLTYAVSFVHDIVPHAHDHNPVLKDIELSLLNDNHEASHRKNDKSAMHVDYQKFGVLDYVICLFESVNHGVTGHHEFKSSSQDQFQLRNVDIKVCALPTISFQSVYGEISIDQEVTNSFINKTDYSPLSVNLDCTVLRGPPVFSC